MKLSIMQPYFFPYIGYFSLIANSDRFVVFDITQYTPKTWINRNRILHPSKGWQYITVPLKKASINIKIHEVEILSVQDSKKRILGQIEHYKRKAPYYKITKDIVESTFNGCKSNSLVELNVNGIKTVCDYLGINFDYIICSETNFDLPEIKHSGQWALEISNLLNADEYINPLGGKELFKEEEFKQKNIKLSFLNPPDFHYPTSPYQFIEHLSILDVIMWNDPKMIRNICKLSSN